MIIWPKPEEIGYDSNGFKQKLLEIFIQHYSNDKQQLNAQIQKWRKIIKQIPTMKSNNLQKLKLKVRKGIPDCLRIKIWPLLIDKSTDVIPYKKTLVQGNFKFNKTIDLDLSRTFPQNINFNQKSQCYKSLRNVLNVISVAFPKMGYCQGLNFIAATIILKVNDEEAYDILCHILQNLNHKYLLSKLSLVRGQLYILERLIQKNHNEIWSVLKQFEIEPIQFASSWFITLFCNCLPFRYNLRLIDVYLLQGEKIIYRVALQILQYKKKHILQLKQFDDVLLYLKNYDEFNYIDVDQFFQKMFKISLSRRTIDKFKSEFRNLNQEVL